MAGNALLINRKEPVDGGIIIRLAVKFTRMSGHMEPNSFPTVRACLGMDRMKALLGVTLLIKPDQKGIIRVPAWIRVGHGMAVIALRSSCAVKIHVVQVIQTIEWRCGIGGVPVAVLTVERRGSKVAGIVD